MVKLDRTKFLFSKSYRDKIQKSLSAKPKKIKLKKTSNDNFIPEGFSFSDFNTDFNEDKATTKELAKETGPTEAEQRRKLGFTFGSTTITYDGLRTVYENYPLVFRGVNIRANEVVARGFELKIKGEENEQSKAALELISEFVDRNGLRWGLTRQLSVDADVAGNGWYELYKNEVNGLWEVSLISPDAIDFKRDTQDNIVLVKNKKDPRYLEPEGYVWKKGGSVIEEKDIKWERIVHLIFNKVGGGFLGISTIQPIYKTIERVMNIEEGFGEAGYRTGFGRQLIKYGDEKHPPTPKMRKRAREIAEQLASNDIIIYPPWYEITQQPVNATDPGLLNNYFIHNMVSCLGVPKFLLLGTAAGEGNRAVADVQSKHFASLIMSNQLKIKDCYENQIFRRVLDAEGFTDVIIEMIWNPIIEEDTGAKIDRIIKLYAPAQNVMGIIDREEARALLSDFIGIAEEDEEQEEMEQKEVVKATKRLSTLTTEQKAQNNRIVNFDFNKSEDARAEIQISINDFYEKLRTKLVNIFEKTNKIITNISHKEFEGELRVGFARAYIVGYKHGAEKVDLKMKKLLKEDEFDLIDKEAMKKVEMFATTLALKETSEIVNKVNIQIALGLGEGEGISQIKKRIEDTFEKYGGSTGRFKKVGTRAELIARTETLRVTNYARIDAYSDAGIQKVEWLTYIDENTCAECIALNGRVFNVGEFPEIPRHPNGRCTVIPIL